LSSHRPFLSRLIANRRGNALPMMALIMALLMAFVGCAVDGARMYMVNARLQQACDAGVLAGRKAMTDTTTSNTTLDATATAAANAFFANNLRIGWYGITSLSFTPAKTADAQVSAAARAVVPMTLMRFFGYSSITLNAVCQATYQISDTDVLFVLDTTGSMACLPSDDETTCNNYISSNTPTSYKRPADGTNSGNSSTAGYPGSGAYYEPEKSGSRISALRSAVLSFYDTMAASIDVNTRVRYGFVTYTSTVNAGRAIMDINPAYMAGGVGSLNTSWNYQTRVLTGSGFSLFCLCIMPNWQYKQSGQLLTTYVTGAPTVDPTKFVNTTDTWEGCIEEAYTTPGVTSFSTSSLPNDLNPDLKPGADIRTQWKPMWTAVTYARNNYTNPANATSSGDSNSHPNLDQAATYKAGLISCGKPVSRLAVMTRAQVSNYVNASDFRAMGGTYHDIGMIWGARMISPGGIFAADTAAMTGRDAPKRIIVFLTDGDMAPSQYIYGAYGIEYYDQRVSGGNLGNLKNYHNARFLAACAAAKAKNISVWTVSLGMNSTSELTQCATSPSQALSTTSGSGLAAQFATIASKIAKLRISK
jgi:Flp pilus assembly protein TadG